MKKILLGAAIAACGLCLAQGTAEAIELTFSDNGIGNVMRLRGGVPLPFNFSLNAGIGGSFNLGAIVKLDPALTQTLDQTTSDLLAKTAPQVLGLVNQKLDLLLDLDLNFAYNYTLVEVGMGPLGEFKPTLSPYLGYRHMFTWLLKPEVNISTLSGSLKKFNTQLGGINAGLNFNLTLPLGFSAYADGGATFLTGGGFSGDFDVNSKKEGNIDTKGTVLPHVGLGARWTMPFLEMASLYAGYNLLFLPDNLRYQTDTLSGKNSMIHSVNFGLSVLFFSI